MKEPIRYEIEYINRIAENEIVDAHKVKVVGQSIVFYDYLEEIICIYPADSVKVKRIE